MKSAPYRDATSFHIVSIEVHNYVKFSLYPTITDEHRDSTLTFGKIQSGTGVSYFISGLGGRAGLIVLCGEGFRRFSVHINNRH